jgi:hypothetical protein
MDKDTTKITLTEYLNPLNHKFVSDYTQKHNLDRYVKKLDSLTTTKLFVFAQLMQIRSYTDLSLHLKQKKKLQEVTGLSSISTAQLSRKWRDMECSFLAKVFHHMVQQVVTRFGVAQTNKKMGLMNVVDASTISLCLSKYRWATLSKHKSGVKIHLRFVHLPEVSFPDKAIITEAKRNERMEMDSLIVEDPGVLNVFDRGYVDYYRFDSYCEKGVRFVTSLRYNANYQIEEERSVEPHSNILKDSTIWLGYRNTRYVMKHRLRLIECLDKEGKQFPILTNDFDRTAKELGDIYRNRWQIELFFKWIKQHLYLKSCYGTSRNAVHNQIYAALITFCLTLLMQAQVGHKGTLLELKKHLELSWGEGLKRFIQALFRPPDRRSAGRRKGIPVERIFEETLQQYEAGDIDHLDDMTMGPLVC